MMPFSFDWGLESRTVMPSKPENDLLRFPCELPIKIFGKNEPTFRAGAVAIVRSHFSDLDEENIRQQSSSGGRFLSLTITVSASSREQVDALYRDLSISDCVLMVL
jgi:putative lipoic acid-binding regulatory protein